jgi:predicted GTPase
MDELEATIDKADVEAVVIGTPIDLASLINIEKPHVRIQYELQEIGKPNLEDILKDFVKKHDLK